MKDNLVKFPTKQKAVKTETDKTIKLPKIVCGAVSGSRLKEVGIDDGDELMVDTMQAVGNGDLIVIQSGDIFDCGFVLFLGDGKLMLTYYNTRYEPETYTLSEIKIIGRVLHSSRDWRNYTLPKLTEVKTNV